VARSVDRIALGLFYSPHDVGLYQNALVFYENLIVDTLAQVHTVGSTALGKLQATHEALRRRFIPRDPSSPFTSYLPPRSSP
jgi:PST family polysaccharide transporter